MFAEPGSVRTAEYYLESLRKKIMFMSPRTIVTQYPKLYLSHQVSELIVYMCCGGKIVFPSGYTKQGRRRLKSNYFTLR